MKFIATLFAGMAVQAFTAGLLSALGVMTLTASGQLGASIIFAAFSAGVFLIKEARN